MNLYDLEEDWRDLVHSSDELSEKLVQQQTAIWELAQTELSYIHILQVVKDVSVFFSLILFWGTHPKAVLTFMDPRAPTHITFRRMQAAS